jgi:hypothetical protein
LKSACWFNVTVNGSQKTGLLDSFICEPWHFISSADEGVQTGDDPLLTLVKNNEFALTLIGSSSSRFFAVSKC